MSWLDWLTLALCLVFVPLYVRAAWREAQREQEARLQGRRQDRDDEDLANP